MATGVCTWLQDYLSTYRGCMYIVYLCSLPETWSWSFHSSLLNLGEEKKEGKRSHLINISQYYHLLAISSSLWGLGQKIRNQRAVKGSGCKQHFWLTFLDRKPFSGNCGKGKCWLSAKSKHRNLLKTQISCISAFTELFLLFILIFTLRLSSLVCWHSARISGLVSMVSYFHFLSFFA